MSESALSRLDDLSLIERLDPAHIFQLTLDFPDQCRTAIQLGNEADLSGVQGDARNVVLAGMGGSAAAGDYLQAVMDRHGACPFLISRDYSIPDWVGEYSLVICSSYSGNTEETLASYAKAMDQGARILCITSGGKLAELARENGNALITIPGGQPPRTAIGYMFYGPLLSLFRLELLRLPESPDVASLLDGLARKWGPQASSSGNEAKLLASELYGKVPVIYGLGGWQYGVAKRWKAQVNENAKTPAFANSFPELNHNEILGWKGVDRGEEWAMVSLEDGTESAKMQARRRFTFTSFPGVPSHRALAKGATLLERLLSLSYLGDFVSLYLSVLAGVDPGDIRMLERMKTELARVN